MTRWTHGLIRRLVIICDLAMIATASAIAYAGWQLGPLSRHIVFAVIGALVFVQVLRVGSAYRVEHYTRLLRQMSHIVIGLVPAMVVVVAVDVAVGGSLNRTWRDLLAWAIITFIALMAGRLFLVRPGMAIVSRKALLRRRIALIGERERARAFIARCRADEGSDLVEFIGIFEASSQAPRPDAAPPDAKDPPLRGGVADLLALAKSEPVDLVAIVEPWDDARRISALADQMYRIAADVVVDLEPEGFMLHSARLVEIGGQETLQVQQRPLKGSLGLLKTVEDYVVAVIGIILTAPILLAAAIAIALDSPGPVLFRQPRVGLNNKIFNCYKLRTMRTDPQDDGSAGTVKTDPRITRVGAILRRLSIDELPQLWNVLRGEMSIVGPRPHVPNMRVASNVRYEAVDRYVERYRVKPGITGWAQINGMRGGIHTVEKAEQGVELDLYYIENWSIWFDIRIMLLTITRGLAGPSVF